MLKLKIQLNWLSLSFTQSQSRNHSINLVLYNQQGEQLSFERKVISSQQNQYELETLSPFMFHMIVDQNKNIVCPFQLKLLSKITIPPLVTNIMLDFTNIFQHYLSHQLNQEISPLQQQFQFDEGVLSYSIIIQEVQTVNDPEELNHFNDLFEKGDSSIMQRKVQLSQLNTQDPTSKQNSKLTSADFNEQESSHITQNQPPSSATQLPRTTKRLKSYHSMSEMTMTQLAKNVQSQNKKKYVQVQKESELYKTNRWYLKLGQQNHSSHHNENEGFSFKLKLLILLLVSGLSLLLYDMVTDVTMQERGVTPKKRNGPKKIRVAKHKKSQQTEQI